MRIHYICMYVYTYNSLAPHEAFNPNGRNSINLRRLLTTIVLLSSECCTNLLKEQKPILSTRLFASTHTAPLKTWKRTSMRRQI